MGIFTFSTPSLRLVTSQVFPITAIIVFGFFTLTLAVVMDTNEWFFALSTKQTDRKCPRQLKNVVLQVALRLPRSSSNHNCRMKKSSQSLVPL